MTPPDLDRLADAVTLAEHYRDDPDPMKVHPEHMSISIAEARWLLAQAREVARLREEIARYDNSALWNELERVTRELKRRIELDAARTNAPDEPNGI